MRSTTLSSPLSFANRQSPIANPLPHVNARQNIRTLNTLLAESGIVGRLPQITTIREKKARRPCPRRPLKMSKPRSAAQQQALNDSLLSAAKAGDSDEVSRLLSQGADVSSSAEKVFGNTSLHMACSYNRTAVADVLVSNGAPLEAQNVFGEVPLDLACRQGAACVPFLLQAGASVNGSAKPGKNTPFNDFCFVAWGPLGAQIASMFLERGVDVNVRGEGGITPLHAACSNGPLPLIRYLLENGASLEAVTARGRTAMDIAVSDGKAEAVSLLASRGASIKPAALMKVCSRRYRDRKYSETVWELLRGGAPTASPAASSQLHLEYYLREMGAVGHQQEGSEMGSLVPFSSGMALARGGALLPFDRQL
jgi:ankyrin repeat protein